MTRRLSAPTAASPRKTSPLWLTMVVFLWGLLGCCIPIVGLILYLVWKNERPRTARAVGIGALVSVGILILYYIIVIAVGVSIFSLAS